MRFQVILDTRHGGASYGTTDDVIEADSPDAAEQSAIEQWTALRPSCTFHPLLTIELSDDAPATLGDVDAECPCGGTFVFNSATSDTRCSECGVEVGLVEDWVTNGGEPPQGDGPRHAYGDYGKFYRVLNFTGYGDDFVNFADALELAKTKFDTPFVSMWIAERVRDEQGERELRRVKVPNPLSGVPTTFCTEHEAGECFDGCPNAYAEHTPQLINGAVEVPIDTSKTNDQHEAASAEGR